MRPLLGLGLTLVVAAAPVAAQAEWQPKKAPLMTRWAKEVTADKVHPEYPRPQLVREHWQNLNGVWQYAITAKDSAKPQAWDGEILVPFPVESALSGVMQRVGPDKRLWYRRTFTVPKDAAWQDKTILLHFGAVDWDAKVWVNGTEVVTHQGGYDPFSADITKALKKDAENELIVSVYDASDVGYQPRGKQVQNPHGIWYTPVTGIWQTVWMEPVAKSYIRSIVVTPDIDQHRFLIKAEIGGGGNARVDLTARCEFEHKRGNDRVKGNMAGAASPATDTITLDVGPNSEPSWWSPDNPKLFDITLELKDGNQVVDRAMTYSALRKIALGKDDKGVTRMFLNNQPLFQYGTLDQGWWPDGLYTAPTDEALKFDIEITKKYGFNMIRKHVKVEPARWYYWADKLGMLVWQDMPNGDKHAKWNPFGDNNGTEMTRSPESMENYRREWKNIMDFCKPFPCIVAWVPFNEGWGQSNTVEVTNWTKQYDPTRLVNPASGGNDFPVGDIVDYHRYPGPFAPKTEPNRAAVLGEYGGLGLPMKGHTWQDEKNWGYRSFTSQEALTEAYLDLIDKLHPMIDRDGLAGAIYTQTTDVEIEVNGLLTYDREVEKLPVAVLAEAHKKLWQPSTPTTTIPVLATAETAPAEWQYTTDKPADDWFQPEFNATSWQSGKSGFGEPSTPGSRVNTIWKSNDLWLRRTFDVASVPQGQLRLRIHHDEDAAVYLNGTLIKRVSGYTTEYVSLRLSAEAQQALKPGRNTLAVHCRQTGGGQYIDVGLEAWTPTK
uniref:Beta-galactosidase n=1 Tax=Schlesneria paludicola TaxID=360056 RepID=A0A7C2P116_9PLAN